MSEQRPINLERLGEASIEQLELAYAATLAKAHDAPHDMRGDPPIIDGSQAWARFSREACRIGDEIARRKSRT